MQENELPSSDIEPVSIIYYGDILIDRISGTELLSRSLH